VVSEGYRVSPLFPRTPGQGFISQDPRRHLNGLSRPPDAFFDVHGDPDEIQPPRLGFRGDKSLFFRRLLPEAVIHMTDDQRKSKPGADSA
jgi:hypothetical protein